jgi:hypothetical protein
MQDENDVLLSQIEEKVNAVDQVSRRRSRFIYNLNHTIARLMAIVDFNDRSQG